MSDVAGWARRERQSLSALALLLIVLIAAYSNHFHNSFHFDDAHTIVNNAAIREVRNIPHFFSDAATFSALPTNQSYRPLVSTLLALDYSLGRGLRPFWFHLSVFALFAALVLLLAFVLHQLLEGVAAFPSNRWIALFTATLYGVHAANADTVNYLIASADVISTLGVVASFAVYFAFPVLRRYQLFVLPAAVCILAKPPAAIFGVLFAVYFLLFPGSEGRRFFSWLREVLPSLLICAVVLWFVQHMTPHTWVAGAYSSHNYLITQPYVILEYARTFVWPSGLSADYDLDAFTTTDNARFWLGFAFTCLFLATAVTLGVFKRTRLIAFGFLWFFIALLPTSLFPLAEVMNDHRTFLPYIGLIIALAGGVQLLWSRFPARAATGKAILAGVGVLLLCGSAYATFQRNKVWRTEETLWHDVTIKSPANGRGLMNYGTTLMERGNYDGALDYFHRAEVLNPRYPFLMINLAIAEGATKQTDLAEQHFRSAMQLAPNLPDSYSYYARFLLGQSRTAEAITLLEKGAELSPGDQTVRDLQAQAQTKTVSPESFLELSLKQYQAGRFAESITAAERALALRPNYAQAWNNIGAARNKLGQYDQAAAACEKALQIQPDFELARNNLVYAREMMKQAQDKK